MPGVQHLTVAADEAEQRLDRWLKRQLPELTQGRIEKLCRKGEIRVDGGRAKAATRVAPGQVVRVPPVPDIPPPPPAPLAPPEAEDLKAAVVFRDDHLIALNKPPGLAVQGGSGVGRHVAGLLPALAFGRADAPRLVHRIDKDTSGLLVLARTGAAAVALAKAFRSRAVEKVYFALVAGRPSPAAGTIRWGLVKAGRPGEGEKMRPVHPDAVASTEGAKGAVTDYRVIEQVGGRCAWVALRPVTGRTHQLRAHMAALGTPIAGDGKYGGRGQENPGDGWGAGLGAEVGRRLHLHAARLALPHPVTGRRLHLSAPLPEHMARSLELLALDPESVPEPIFEG